MFGLFKRNKPDPAHLLEVPDPQNKVSRYHRSFMEMQRATLEITKNSGEKSDMLTSAEFLQVLLFSRGATDYLTKYNFPNNDEGGSQDLWALRQQAIVSEMFSNLFSGNVDQRSTLVNLSLTDIAPETSGYKLAARGFEAANKMHKAVTSGNPGDVGFALVSAMAESMVS